MRVYSWRGNRCGALFSKRAEVILAARESRQLTATLDAMRLHVLRQLLQTIGVHLIHARRLAQHHEGNDALAALRIGLTIDDGLLHLARSEEDIRNLVRRDAEALGLDHSI